MEALGGYRLFSTCPESARGDASAFRQRAVDVARWSEDAGCEGMLIYTDNRLVDPWLVAALSIQATEKLAPLVAVQPVYMHPYSMAKMVASLALLYDRGVVLNMVAGGFRNDLEALDDPSAHDDRYTRLVEYTSIAMRLLANDGPVSHDGRYYRVRNLRLQPDLPPDLLPEVFVSGSSEAGLAAAVELGATAIQYPKPAQDDLGVHHLNGLKGGIRVGVIARDDEDDAWRVATARFPGDRKGQLMHQLATKLSDSSWHRDLAEMEPGESSPYWLFPFQNYKTFCPYLVGSYERVAAELAKYLELGYSTFILDIPPDPDELHHTRTAFELSARVATDG